ncbi:hypothetical protein O2W14_06725 [Modestobacter sp. VKM Ac-2986]|uniref:hypothetical protein n=1 Tax=Modestobacter sp. VKM Ac-2986 TaxID=3004140 RepID=UPI0022AACBB4|nr:hypothetical protein [Modestobacter sp. VKM Ac-2986]MCZ2828524.1 hypothetical protein [Modestobacter sp. VKM Ac-2986]
MSAPAGETWFHVTSVRNRASIRRHGLDVRRMGAAPGIAGSPVPEQDGVFLADDEFLVDWFVRMNNTGGPVDVWAVDGVVRVDLEQSPEGYLFQSGTVPADRLWLVRQDVPPLGATD